MLVKCLLSYHCHSIVSTSTTGQKLIGLVRNVIESYKESLTILQLEHFSSFLKLFGYRGRKTITITLAETLLENGVIVPSVEEVSSFILSLFVLVCCILSLLFPYLSLFVAFFPCCCFPICPCLLHSFLVVSLFVLVCCILSLLFPYLSLFVAFFPCCFLICPCLLHSFLIVSLFVLLCSILSLLFECCSHVAGCTVHCVH